MHAVKECKHISSLRHSTGVFQTGLQQLE